MVKWEFLEWRCSRQLEGNCVLSHRCFKRYLLRQVFHLLKIERLYQKICCQWNKTFCVKLCNKSYFQAIKNVRHER